VKADQDDRLSSARAKLSRARRHFAHLSDVLRAYLEKPPYVVSSKRDPTSRRLHYVAVHVAPTPIELPAIIGDTVHNLRSALDHLAYQLVWIGTGKPPGSHVYFPIADDSSKYPAQRDRQLRGASPDVIRAVDALKTFRGGDDVLWRLHRLNNIDKHRVLLVAGSAFHSVNVGAIMTRTMREAAAAHPAFAKSGFPALDLFLRPAERTFPLKAGETLFIDGPDAPEDPNIQFRFEVAFGEDDIGATESVGATIEPMIERVDSVIKTMAAFF
jgi:hypothetical protein